MPKRSSSKNQALAKSEISPPPEIPPTLPRRKQTILECPECFSRNAELVFNDHVLRAQCLDCDHAYPVHVRRASRVSGHQPPKEKRDTGHPRAFAPVENDQNPDFDCESPKSKELRTKQRKTKIDYRNEIEPATAPPRSVLAEELDDALTRSGAAGVRREQRVAAQLARKHMIALEGEWHKDTQWLRDLASATNAPSSHANHASASHAQARYARRWRPRFLAFLSVTDSPTISAKAARVDLSTVYRHRHQDHEFAAHWTEACLRATDLAEARARQLAVEGVLEPVYYMGVIVDYVRKYDGKLLIELLRAKRPDTFKTAGVNVNVGVRGDVFVLTEDMRHQLQETHKELLADLRRIKNPNSQTGNVDNEILTTQGQPLLGQGGEG